MSLDELIAIEEIKQLKARYFRLMDRKQWDQWAELLTEDVEVAVIVDGRLFGSHRGREAFVASNRSLNEEGSLAVHHGHGPEITITSPTTAVGIWALYDVKIRGGASKVAHGYYDDQYVKVAGKWKIRKMSLELMARTDRRI